MQVEITLGDVRAVLERLAETFEARRDELNDLDTRLGDGDHGFSMARGFGAVREYLGRTQEGTIGALLGAAGMQFNEAAGSTIGILMFSALREAGKVAGDKERLGLGDLADLAEAATAAVARRGKSAIGKKTILDSLAPAAAALRKGAGGPDTGEAGQDELEVIRSAARAAREGAEATKDMRPAVGRARWFAERSSGEIDPGAVSGAIIMDELARYLEERASG